MKKTPARPKRSLAADAKPRAKIPETFIVGGKPRLPLMPMLDQAAAFRPYTPPKGVVPEGFKLAMDEAPSQPAYFASAGPYNVAFAEGYTFLGYPYLSLLMQIPEYRLIVETISGDATRKWIKVKSVSEDEGQKERISELEAELDRLNAQQIFKTISEHDSAFGRAHLYLDTGDTDNRNELITPIGDGNDFSAKKFKKGFLRAIKAIEPVWCYPARYESADPLKDSWYRPDSWFVMGKEVHRTRLLTFTGRPVPDILKPAFAFGGLSLTQMAKPYVDNWLQTRQSVNDIIHAFSVMVLSTDLDGLLQTGGAELEKRINLFNQYRDNKALMVLDKDDETFQNVSAPLGTLDKLQAQAQEHICSVSKIPLVKYTGLSPTGLNASSDGEIRSYYDNEHAYQEYFFDPHFTTIFKLAQINCWGKVDEDLVYEWEPLWEMSEKEQADLQKILADRDAVLIDKGAIAPVEVRERLAGDVSSGYEGLDVEDVPETMEPEPGNLHERIDDTTEQEEAAA